MTDTTNPADEGFADTSEEVVDDQDTDQVSDQADDSDDDQGDAEGDEDEGSQDDQDEDDDSEEVEFGGKKYKLPKDLKPALMMEADYRRKTQELAEQRRS